MPAELATIFLPFRLRNPGGQFSLDTVVANYQIEVYRAGVLFAPVGGFTITTPGSQLGRHILSFLGGPEDDYLFFIDHVTANFDVSIDSGLITSDKFLTSALATGVRQVLMEKILRNKLVTDDSTGKLTVFDDDGTTPLLVADIKEDVAELQPYRGQGINVRFRLV